MKEKTMNMLDKMIIGTALALGLGCGSYRSKNITLPESCAEVVSIERSILHDNFNYEYDVSCKETDGGYGLYLCNYDHSRKEYFCISYIKFELKEKK